MKVKVSRSKVIISSFCISLFAGEEHALLCGRRVDDFAVGHQVVVFLDDRYKGTARFGEHQLRPRRAQVVQQQELGFVLRLVLNQGADVLLADEIFPFIEVVAAVVGDGGDSIHGLGLDPPLAVGVEVQFTPINSMYLQEAVFAFLKYRMRFFYFSTTTFYKFFVYKEGLGL